MIAKKIPLKTLKMTFFPEIHSPVWLSVLFISLTRSSSTADLKCPPDFSTPLQKKPSSLAESCILKVNRSSGLPNTLNQKAPCTYFTTRQFAKSGSALAAKTVKPLEASGLFHTHIAPRATLHTYPTFYCSNFPKPPHTLRVFCANCAPDITVCGSTDATCAVWGNTNSVKITCRNVCILHATYTASKQSNLQVLDQSREVLQTKRFLFLSTARLKQEARNTSDVITNRGLLFQRTLH